MNNFATLLFPIVGLTFGCSLLNTNATLSLDEAYEKITRSLLNGDGVEFTQLLVADELPAYGCSSQQASKLIEQVIAKKLSSFKVDTNVDTLAREPGRLVKVLWLKHEDGRKIGIPFWIYQTEAGPKVSCGITSALIGAFGTYTNLATEGTQSNRVSAWADGATEMRPLLESYGIKRILMPETKGKALTFNEWVAKQQRQLKSPPPASESD